MLLSLATSIDIYPCLIRAIKFRAGNSQIFTIKIREFLKKAQIEGRNKWQTHILVGSESVPDLLERFTTDANLLWLPIPFHLPTITPLSLSLSFSFNFLWHLFVDRSATSTTIVAVAATETAKRFIHDSFSAAAYRNLLPPPPPQELRFLGKDATRERRSVADQSAEPVARVAQKISFPWRWRLDGVLLDRTRRDNGLLRVFFYPVRCGYCKSIARFMDGKLVIGSRCLCNGYARWLLYRSNLFSKAKELVASFFIV